MVKLFASITQSSGTVAAINRMTCQLLLPTADGLHVSCEFQVALMHDKHRTMIC